MFDIKKVTLPAVFFFLFAAVGINDGSADELTTLLLASAQVGEQAPSTTTENVAPEPPADNPVATPESPQLPIVENSQEDQASPPPDNETQIIAEENLDVTPETEETSLAVPALPAPVSMPEDSVNIGEPMRRNDAASATNKKMDAIEALRYLLGDLEELQRRKDVKSNSDTYAGKYLVKVGDTLDEIIEETMSEIPIRKGILRRAFMSINTHAFPSDSPHSVLAGAYLKIPKIDDIRDIIFPRGIPYELVDSEQMAKKPSSKQSKKDWVRFP